MSASTSIVSHELVLISAPKNDEDKKSWETESEENGEKVLKSSFVLNGGPEPGVSDESDSSYSTVNDEELTITELHWI